MNVNQLSDSYEPCNGVLKNSGKVILLAELKPAGGLSLTLASWGQLLNWAMWALRLTGDPKGSDITHPPGTCEPGQENKLQTDPNKLESYRLSVTNR